MYIDLAKVKSGTPDYSHEKRGFVFVGSETQKLINYECAYNCSACGFAIFSS